VSAMGASEESLAEEVEKLTHLGVLRERPGGDRFGFAAEETRARMYQSLTASRLRVLHRKIAEAMERQYPDPPAEILPELGRHFFLGRVPEKSHEYNRRAAALARSDDSPEVAAHHLERARIDLRGLPGNHVHEEAELDAELADLYYNMGDVATADRLYAEGLEHAAGDDLHLRAHLFLGRAEVARDALDFDSAARSAKSAEELMSNLGDLAGIAGVHRILGRVAYQKGDFDGSLEEGMKALDLVQQVNDPRLLGRICIDIGNTFSMLGPEVRDEALQWYDRAIERLSDVGDWVEVARAHFNLARLVGERQPGDGLEHLARCREFAERAHDPRWVALSLSGGIEMRLALGQVEEAERDNEQARRIFERSEHPSGVFQVALNGGIIAERRGQWEDAELAYHGALQGATRLRHENEVAEAQYHLARLYFKTRDIARARAAYQEASKLHLAERKPPLAPAFRELGVKIRDLEPTLEVSTVAVE
ncbi:MAG: hypothetical protein L3J96_00220, partial [Thermoplasmata archaeon]|nr:hypothetical protein [Thermoplasmata archaeon]